MKQVFDNSNTAKIAMDIYEGLRTLVSQTRRRARTHRTARKAKHSKRRTATTRTFERAHI
jgi:hypothetical protein